MSDVSVYYFMRPGGAGDEKLISKRRATLEAIKDRGEAVMPSRRIVDHTEVDGNGFLIGGASESHPVDELWPQIRSLELRAESRDVEALKILDGAQSQRRQTLHSESLELRNQAQTLKAQIDRIKADKPDRQDCAEAPISYWPPRPQIAQP
jgi:hypothetical protein